MSIKTKSIVALFLALLVILAVNPKVVNNIYSSILGRLFLICVVIFFAMNNTTLGLLVALAIITSSNQFGSFVEATLPSVEGMDNQSSSTLTTPTTIGEDNVGTNGAIPVLTSGAVKSSENAKKKLSDIKQEVADGTSVVDSIGVDRTITKNSNQVPLNTTNNTSGEVSPSSEGMLNASTLEGFSSYASV